MYWFPSTSTRSHFEAPPVGLVEIMTEPSSSTATHNFMLGHATPLMALVPSMSTAFHARSPPVGFVEMTACPWLSTATQRCALGQETAISPFGLGIVASSHLAGLPGAVVAVVVGGSVDVVVVGGGEVDGPLDLLTGPEEQPAATKLRTRSEAT